MHFSKINMILVIKTDMRKAYNFLYFSKFKNAQLVLRILYSTVRLSVYKQYENWDFFHVPRLKPKLKIY